MQIRLTVLVPRGGQSAARPCDVLITAPPGTPLAAVTDALATTAAAAAPADAPAGDPGPDPAAHDGPSGHPTPSGRSGRPGHPGHDPVSVYDGSERLDPLRQLLGEPPLIEGAVLSLHSPSPAPVSAYGPARARLHVTAGPDAGGVHLLHGGDVSLGRSAEADVPLDDPDVSRLHCTVRVAEGSAGAGGAVTVSDRGSRNGTAVDGVPVDNQPRSFTPGATLRLGESTVRLEASPSTAGPPPALRTTPDGQGQLRLTGVAADATRDVAPRPVVDPLDEAGGAGVTAAGVVGTAATATAPDTSTPPATATPATPRPEKDRPGAPSTPPRFPTEATTRGTGTAVPPGAPATDSSTWAPPRRRTGRGIGAWARRLTPGRDLPGTGAHSSPAEDGWDVRPEHGRARPEDGPRPPGGAVRDATAYDQPGPGTDDPSGSARWPDPATVLLTALGPGPRLWERGPGHADALTVRLGSAHRRGGSGDPVTIDLRAAGSLGLAGPRARLARMARSLLAQLAALHAPGGLEIVLLAADRTRELRSRTAEWSWLGWLPHVHPGHGQDCRLLTAYDDEQATARTEELVRRLEEARPPSTATATAPAERAPTDGPGSVSPSRADTAPARAEAASAAEPAGPESRTLLVVDGDPGSVELRETLSRIAVEGPAAGIHVMCLAETPSASPASPLDATLRAAYAASPPFRRCHTLALLSGAVATAVRLIPHGPAAAGRSAGSGPAHGTVATVDGVSAAWAERFARALAPLREAEGTAGATPHSRRAASALPRDCRLLEELGLARATPAAVLNRWDTTARSGAPAADPARVPPVAARLVLGVGPRGTVESDLATTGAHALVTGPAGSGRTEFLRALAASLAAGERPDRLGLILVDGGGTTRDGGLRSTAELPHVNSSLSIGDPVRMREFAQSLSAELKRRTELLGDLTYEQHLRTSGVDNHRVVAPRAPAEPRSGRGTATSGPAGERPELPEPPGAHGQRLLPRLVVLVDDFDQLVDPALGDPGRPAAGSVVRALESVAAGGAAVGMHLITASGRPDRTAHSRADHESGVRIELTGMDGQDTAPGRGSVLFPDGSRVPVQAGRVTGRIPRTATVRPTVVPLDWARAGDPPTRRPVRELGNGPTDLALLASAMTRAARSLGSSSGESGECGAPAAVRSAGPTGRGVEASRGQAGG